jgi:hypothetical protein
VDAAAPILDEALLDQLARIYALAALDELMEQSNEQAHFETADANGRSGG